MSYVRRLLGLSGVLAMLGSVACAAPEGQTSAPTTAPAAPPAAAFVTIVGERVYMQALMKDATLVVTDGCVCVIQPPDAPEVSLKYRLALSEGATMDGETISIPEGGQARIGDTVDTGGGGIFDLESLPENLRVPAACDLDLPVWAVTSLEVV
ncbi:hypothetical protein [Polymorphospora sp. NPDC050346]|uniref:hypothetical protein n=1 Tax=Polymorphospora sp. NPDC050346 TaxID=3155780 RepID=UPI0033D65C4F